MLRPLFGVQLAGLISLCLLASDVWADSPTQTVPADDPNYALLGEFVGQVAGDGDSTETLGLQIRPVGGDNFDAMSFIGGLPGQDELSGQPMRLIGRRSGDLVVLSGGPFAMFVSSDACTLIDREGNKLGTLERVARVSPTMNAAAPEGAVVLFDGTNTDQFVNGEMTDDGLLKQGADVRPMFQDFNLHLEFRLPYMPENSDQARGNSGLYLQSRYECQVLDSFAQDAVFNGLGAIYRFKKPDVNMCLPPLVWQTYDVQFTAPRWASDGTKLREAHITSWINGVKVQDNVALPTKTGHGKEEAPTLEPIRLQDHKDEVRFRNVWVIDRGLVTVEFPVAGGPDKEVVGESEEVVGDEVAAEEVAAEEVSPEGEGEVVE